MNINKFKNKIIKNKPLLGIDFGEKRIGLALSDSLLMIASPYKIVYSVKEFDAEIQKLDLGGVIVGYPLQMNGEEGEIAKKARAFGDRIYTKFKLPIFLKDERLSSCAVERMMIEEFDLSREKRKKAIDKNAAAFILQGFLDQLSNIKE
ncbi:MAG: putative Holliday junction resolvase [Alphaproteobacteria bacterium ADurb.Bin438]|nr:MAG: putative Holliday junction resolvase [Alphaproteobacteria bacterium ADurb.Bin438]